MKDLKPNYTLYAFKVLAMLMIINLHHMLNIVPISSILYELCRIAVPFFFIVSGYYGYNPDFTYEVQKNKQKTIQSLKTIVVYFALYFVFNIYFNYISGTLHNLIAELKNPINYFYLIVLSYATPLIGAPHLWFYLSLVIVYILMIAFNKFIRKNKHVTLLFSLLILLSVYVFELQFSTSVASMVYRNAFFLAFPLYYIGYYLHMENIIDSISFKHIFLLFIISTIISTTEFMLINKSLVFYINSITFAIFLIVLSLKHPTLINNSVLTYIGKYLSKDVYLFHFFLVLVLYKVHLNKNLGYIFIAISSIIVAYIINICKTKIVSISEKI